MEPFRKVPHPSVTNKRHSGCAEKLLCLTLCEAAINKVCLKMAQNEKKGGGKCIAQALSAAVARLQNDSWQFSIHWLPLRG